ncbi:PLP-dependent transferase [Lentinus brumalis]|uniref:PLP-dependent transferase n=1 Tax=Lentinus brumalis TaxID=2498619 RepID=A0A371D862_9APHY|nr:PLP-dependent transferase [Polyporus brumalis]
MGNSHSHASAPGLDMHRAPRPLALPRKRSQAFSTLTLGCAPTPYAPSLPSYREYPIREDASVSDREEKRSFDPPPLYALSTTPDLHEDGAAVAYKAFLKHCPQYQLTWILDALRRSDFARLDRSGETYVDYMGGSLYPESLIRVHAGFLTRSILGNTHSVSNSSRLSAACATEARQAVLAFFRAPPGYTVVFTANATGALKLVGEAFPFTDGSSYVLGADSHNSVHGIRKFATARGAGVHYIESTPHGGVDVSEAQAVLTQHRPRGNRAPCLFALTGQSNISNAKNPLSLIEFAASQGYSTLLDAAALAPSSVISLTDTPVDAMAVSFYKMFGFPTGVGALVVKESFLARLERPWFAGGTVDVVQAPGTIVTLTSELHERFEDGTINYLNLPAITDGLRFLSAYLPFLPLRLSSLTRHLITSLSELRHDTTGAPVVQILSRQPSKVVRSVGEQSDSGSVVALLFLFPSGQMIPNSFVEYAAQQHNISLRTGCMCNPGGAAALLGLRQAMSDLPCDATLRAFEQRMGRELGVVRISLGLASDFRDVWRVIEFAKLMATDIARSALWEEWLGDKTGVAL